MTIFILCILFVNICFPSFTTYLVEDRKTLFKFIKKLREKDGLLLLPSSLNQIENEENFFRKFSPQQKDAGQPST